MAKKALRNLALLGGLGAAAYMMGKKKGEKGETKQSKEDDERDAREAALAGPLRQTPKTEDRKPETSVREAPPKPRPNKSEASPAAPTRAAPAATPAAPTRTAPASTQTQEGATASRMPREARGVTAGSRDNPYFGRTVEQRSASLKAGGGTVKMQSGGKVSASKRADGCAVKGKTRGRMV